MALTHTQAFRDVWDRKASKVASIQVRYRRRFFDNSSPGGFVLEPEFTTLSEGEFKDAGEIVNSLDVPFLNIFKTSAVTLRLNNSDNQWIFSVAAPSIFQADEIAPLGYDPFLTEFQIRFGYEIADGTTEYLVLFTGVATNYNFEGNEADVEVTVESNARLLQAADASKVADVFTQESTSPATTDGSNKEFFTTSEGVGRISIVRVDGVVQIQGVDYQISQLNEAGGPAKITFTSAPATGLSVDTTGLRWKANLTIETLVGLLCDEAGITVAKRIIDPVLFPGGLSGTKTIDSQADWEAGTLQNIDTTSNPDTIRRRWHLINDFDNASVPAWSLNGATISGGKLNGVSGNFAGPSPQPFTLLSQGTWTFVLARSSGSIEIQLASTGGFGLGGPVGTIFLVRYDGSNVKMFTFDIQTAVYTQIGLSLVASGAINIKVFYNKNTGNVKMAHTGTSGVSSGNAGAGLGLKYVVSFLGTGTVDDVNFSHEIIDDMVPFDIGDLPAGTTTIYTSQEFDLLSAPSAWGTLDITEIINDGTTVYETAVASVSGGPFDAFVPLGVGNVIESAFKQFIQVRRTSVTAEGLITSPITSKLVINFQTTSVNVSLAIFAGLTVRTAIERLTRIADYQMVFRSDGIFLFKSKAVTGVPVLSINQENAISELSDYRPGFDRVFNVGQVQYGAYYNEFDGTDAGETPPTSEQRFGRIIRYEDFSDFLLANDVNLGASRSRLIYENNFLPRRRARAKCKIIPFLELSDIIRISYFDNPLFRETIWGDPLQLWGEAAFGEPQNVLARDLDFKIVGIIFSPTEARCELVIEEILS